jgi:hypothetical protein
MSVVSLPVTLSGIGTTITSMETVGGPCRTSRLSWLDGGRATWTRAARLIP